MREQNPGDGATAKTISVTPQPGEQIVVYFLGSQDSGAPVPAGSLTFTADSLTVGTITPTAAKACHFAAKDLAGNALPAGASAMRPILP